MRINRIELLSSNLNETSIFYSEVLGLKVIESSDAEISFKAGSSILTFRKTNIQSCTYHFAFDIPKNKLDEAITWLSSKIQLIQFQGSEIIDFPNWNAKSLYFYDNNGNVLEFIARFANENESYNQFDSSSILSISEIAFVTDHVEELAKEIINTHGLSYYFRQMQREDFSVIGDDDGLIILVSSERNWFPTLIKVKRFPVKATLETDNNILELNYN